MNILNKMIPRLFCLSILFSLFTACEKKVDISLPDDEEDIRVNYFVASDVLPETDLKVDITLLQDNKQYQKHSAAFRFESDLDENIFPKTYQNSDNQQINYAHYTAKSFRFDFAGGGASLLDTLINLQPYSYHCLYLADALTDQRDVAQYQFLAVTEPRSGIPEGQIGVRFINLSAETGSLQPSIISSDGNERALPSSISFLKASDYIFFDTKDAKDGLLRFKLVDTDGTIIYTATPAIVDRSYAVLVRGFKTEQQRQVTRSGSQSTSIITISNNLRAAVRRTY